jgi:hypothetical protein
MEHIDDLIEIRSYTEDDKNFIINSWMNGFKQGCEYFRLIEKSAYDDVSGQVVNKILDSPGTDIKIICLKDETDIILGYSVTEIRNKMIILHWIYVKPDWRDNGLGGLLSPEGITHTTHLTKTGRALLKKHPEVKFNPFII